MGNKILDWVRIGTSACRQLGDSGLGMPVKMDIRELRQPVRERVCAGTRTQTIFDHAKDER